MKQMRPLAAGGNTLQRLLQKWVEEFELAGGLFAYLAPTAPVDDATYDDPHKRVLRDVDADLDGWEPIL